VTFFDVGKGSSVLFEGPEKNILIDAGSSAGASQANYVGAVEDELNDDNGEATLHHVVVSHNDTDHIGYVDDLMDSDDVEVRNLYFNGIDAGNRAEDGVDREFDSSEMNSHIIDQAGASRQITDAGLTVRVARPDTTNIDGVSTSDVNANSLITRVEYGDQTFLMPGDIPAPVEEWVVSKSNIDLTEVDVLQAQHHATQEEDDGVFSRTFSDRLASDTTVVIQNRNTDTSSEFHPNCQALRNMVGEVGGVHWTAEHGRLEITISSEDGMAERPSREAEIPTALLPRVNNGEGGCATG